MRASEKVNIVQNDAEHDFELLCAGEDGLVEVRAEEGQPAPPDPAAPNFFSASTAVQAGSVNPGAMEAEDAELATSSQVPAVAAHQAFCHGR